MRYRSIIFIPVIAFLSLWMGGCSKSDSLNKRLNEDIERENKNVKTTISHPYPERMVAKRLLLALRSATKSSLKQPSLVVADLAETKSEKSLLIYWIQDRPSVSKIEIGIPDKPASYVTLSLHKSYIQFNRKAAKDTVVFYATFLWDSGNEPECLQKKSCAVRIIRPSGKKGDWVRIIRESDVD